MTQSETQAPTEEPSPKTDSVTESIDMLVGTTVAQAINRVAYMNATADKAKGRKGKNTDVEALATSVLALANTVSTLASVVGVRAELREGHETESSVVSAAEEVLANASRDALGSEFNLTDTPAGITPGEESSVANLAKGWAGQAGLFVGVGLMAGAVAYASGSFVACMAMGVVGAIVFVLASVAAERTKADGAGDLHVGLTSLVTGCGMGLIAGGLLSIPTEPIKMFTLAPFGLVLSAIGFIVRYRCRIGRQHMMWIAVSLVWVALVAGIGVQKFVLSDKPKTADHETPAAVEAGHGATDSHATPAASGHDAPAADSHDAEAASTEHGEAAESSDHSATAAKTDEHAATNEHGEDAAATHEPAAAEDHATPAASTEHAEASSDSHATAAPADDHAATPAEPAHEEEHAPAAASASHH